MAALLLAVIAGVVPVLPSSPGDIAHAQEATRPDDATLAATGGLTFSPTVNLSPTYSRTTVEYTGRVANEVNVVTVTTVTNNPDANASVSPGDADSTTEGHQVALRAGQNTRITISVLAENRIARQTYTVMVYRDRSTRSDNANLSVLRLAESGLSPGFSSATTTYNARVAYDVAEVNVTATASDVGAVSVAVTSAGTVTNNSVVALGDRGANSTITITVTAENTTTTKVYTITVYRESGPVLSPVATLVDSTGLTLTGATLAPTFAAGTNEYTARAENATEAVTIAATAQGAPGATVDIMPADQDTGTQGHQVYLTPGTNTRITVTVTAENRSTNTYTVMVYRVRDTASDDGTLSALSLAGVSLSPAFDPATMAYDARVPYNTTTVTVMATAADIGALTPVVTGGTAVTNNAVTLGALGADTTITITVTPESGTGDNEVYTITVYRESGPVLGSDTALSTFETAPVDVTRVGTTNNYTVRATNAQNVLTVTATPMGAPGANADIMPADQDSLTDGHQVYLTAGANTEITVTVTAEDGSTETYTIMAYRIRATPSTDDTLSALRLDGVDISPAFDPETTAYNARVRYDVDKVTLERTATDIGANITVTATSDPVGASVDGDEITLAGQGVNTVVTVAVAAEDGSATENYVITIYRENIVLSDIATLAATDGLSLGTGITLSPTPFSPDTNEYTARATNATAAASVTATAADDPGAMVEIMPADQNTLETGHQIYLTAGANTEITVTVTAEDGSTNTYTFTVYRIRATESTDANLSALSLSGAVLSPAFDPKRGDYTATAAYSTDVTTVMATANDIGAMPIVITPADADMDPSNGHQVALSDRTATRIVVTGEAEDDSTSMVYTIVVYRDSTPSSDAMLQSLSLSDLTLMPAFDPATTAYTAEVDNLEMTTVEAMAAHPGAMVAGTGEFTLVAGDNVIEVTVTAEDDSTQTYTVTVTVTEGRNST